MSETETENEGIDPDLREVKHLLNSNDIFFWLMSGTLLGAKKYGHPLPGDNDYDLGTWATNREKFDKIKTDFEDRGFVVRERYDPAHDRIKGMVTIQRSSWPIDIKFYEKKHGYIYRTIQKNEKISSRCLWIIIDSLYFQDAWESPSNKQEKRAFTKLNKSLVNNTPGLVRNHLIKILSAVWRRSDVEYGLVVLPAYYFESFEKEEFLGISFNVPERADEYLLDEYGEDWHRHNPSGKGGQEKPSHIMYSRGSRSIPEQKREEVLKIVKDMKDG